MDVGDAGHILLSRHVAEDLEQYPRWRPSLHDLGECEVKHELRVGIISLYDDEIGNPAVPKRLKLRKHEARIRVAMLTIGLLLVTGIATAFVLLARKWAKPQ